MVTLVGITSQGRGRRIAGRTIGCGKRLCQGYYVKVGQGEVISWIADQMHRLAPRQPSAILVKAAADAQPVPPGGLFFVGGYSIEYRSGRLTLTGSADGLQPINVDDVADVTVTRPDGSRLSLLHDFSNGCGPLTPVAVVELTPLLQVGHNSLSIELRDQCGGSVGNTDVFLVADDADMTVAGT